MTVKEFLWSERYRPQTIAECILPATIKIALQSFVDKGEIQNMLFSGSSGTGKTTAAKALANEIGCDCLLINASEENGIDVLRTKVKNFAATGSFSGKPKIIILDEADYLSAAFQPALRGLMEEFSTNCRFILTCNHKNRIIPALHSRCAVFDFTLEKAQRPKMAARFFERVQGILKENDVTFNPKVIAKLVERHFPDYRKTLNELQTLSLRGPIDVDSLSNDVQSEVGSLIKIIKEKDWKEMRSWVTQHEDIDTSLVYNDLYNQLPDMVEEAPQVVLILADYSYKSAFAANPSITLVACLTELMATVTFK